MRKIAGAAIACLVLAGCANSSNVAPMGPDAFMVSRQAATGVLGTGTLKAEALTEAEQFCAARNKVFLVNAVVEAPPPYILGNFPKAEVQFTCLAAGDPRLAQQRGR